jgi:hypothetical protein
LFRPRPEERACRIDATRSTARGARLEGRGRPRLAAASCFETHRSAIVLVEADEFASRCDAPQHEAERGRYRNRDMVDALAASPLAEVDFERVTIRPEAD